jgi:hypothetical protein
MSIFIMLYLFALAGGLSAQQARLAKSRSSRLLSGFLAIAFTVMYFGYVMGKDLAIRENARSEASLSAPIPTKP